MSRSLEREVFDFLRADGLLEKELATKLAKQIADASQLIDPPHELRQRCWDDVWDAILDLGMNDFGPAGKRRELRSDKFRRSIERVRRGLRRVQAAVNDIPAGTHASEVASDLDVRPMIKLTDSLLKRYPPAPKHGSATDKRRATEAAYKLLTKYEQTPTTTIDGPFVRLAAVLFGDVAAGGFQQHCRVLLNSAKPPAR